MRLVALAMCLLLAGGCDWILPLGVPPELDALSGDRGVDGSLPPLDSKLPVDAPWLADHGPITNEDGQLPPDLRADGPTGPCDTTPVYDGTFTPWTVPNATGAPKISGGAVAWGPTDDLSAFYNGTGGTAFVQPNCTRVDINLQTLCTGSPGGDTIRIRFYDTPCTTDADCDALVPLVDRAATCKDTQVMYATKVTVAPGTPVQTLRLQSPASTVERKALSLKLTPAP